MDVKKQNFFSRYEETFFNYRLENMMGNGLYLRCLSGKKSGTGVPPRGQKASKIISFGDFYITDSARGIPKDFVDVIYNRALEVLPPKLWDAIKISMKKFNQPLVFAAIRTPDPPKYYRGKMVQDWNFYYEYELQWGLDPKNEELSRGFKFETPYMTNNYSIWQFEVDEILMNNQLRNALSSLGFVLVDTEDTCCFKEDEKRLIYQGHNKLPRRWTQVYGTDLYKMEKKKSLVDL